MTFTPNTLTATDVFAGSDIDQAVPLHAVGLAASWNGIPIPLVTAQSFASWVDAMAHNDSEWSESVTYATSYALHYYGDEDTSDAWDSVGTVIDDNGDEVEVYALSGWVWSL